jgi:hypothetical protein
MACRFYRPKSVTVLGQKFSILYEDPDDLNNVFLDETCEVHAYAEVASREIHIDETLDKEATYRILRHEIIHCAIALSGLKETLTDDQEEAFCVLIESVYDSLQIKRGLP